MARRVALPLAVLLLVATPIAAQSAAVPFRAAQAMWREIVGDGRAESEAPIDKIVVFNALPVAQLQVKGPRARQHALTAQRTALSRIAAAGIPLHVKRSFVTALNAVEVEVGPGDVAALERSPVVRGVYAVRNVYPASVVSSALQVLGPAARPLAVQLPEQGAGVRVALLDGPVDATHPYLLGRVLPGWNAVANAPASAHPAIASALSHGTAMAGIVVGDNGPDGLHGVAPHAQLLPIQVLALRHGVLVGSTGTLLAGLDHALDPNSDGSLLDHVPIVVAPVAEPFAAFAESPEAMAAVSAERAGTLLIASAGNDGPTRARFGTVATPAAGKLWLAVGAVDGRPLLPQVGATAAGGGLDQTLDALPLAGALAPIAGQALPLAAPSGPTRSDPSRPVGQAVSGDSVDDYLGPDGARLVDGKVALVPRDGSSLEAKAIAASAAGARALVVYGDGAVPNAALGLDDRVPIPVLVVPRGDGEALAQGAGTTGAATITFGAAAAPANPDSGTVTAFSSRGLGFHDLVKPEIVAPGVAITTALAGGGFTSVTGTSAAAAQVAGSAAVLLDAHRGWTPALLRGALIGAAQSVKGSSLDGGAIEPVEAQGAGDVDAQVAGSLAILSDPATAVFGLATARTAHSTTALTLHNVTAAAVAATLGFQRDGNGDGSSTAALGADRPRVTIPAHGEVTVNVTLNARKVPRSAGVLGGWIVVSPDGGAPATRIPWALATGGDAAASLLRTVKLSTHKVPLVSDTSTPPEQVLARLTIAVGAVDTARSSKLAIAPVAHLAVDLYRGDTRVTRLLDARSLLPGVYVYGLTGRDGAGKPLPPGSYRIVVDAVSSDEVTSEREVDFQIPAKHG